MTPQTVAPPHRTAATEWVRLSPRLVPVHLGILAAPLAAFALTFAVTGRLDLRAMITLGSILVTALVVSGMGLMRYLTTRYRVTDERIELRSGLLIRGRRAIRLDRVRSVDLTANPVHRLFGLTSVRIGTGEQTASAGRRLTLDGVTRAQGADLRRRLFARRDAAAVAAADDDPIADLDWSWIRYAPLTIWGVGSVLTAAGTAYRTLHEAKIDPLEWDVVRSVERDYGSVPPWFALLFAVLVLVVLGALASTALFVEGWSGYRLDRTDGAIRVRRGLLGTRSITIEERRLGGVELAEPIPLRLAGGARLNAVASGLGTREENTKRRMLTPPAPRAEALRVAAEVLGEDRSPTSVAFRRHPRAALRRRINRALIATALIVTVPAVLGALLSSWLLYVAGAVAVLLVPLSLALAYDAYRALGHARHGGYLVTRTGTFARRTVALREEIIGWDITRSAFQRRAGLLTLGAATQAGDHCYRVRDVRVHDGLDLAEAAVPGLLAPFLEPAGVNLR